MAGQNIRRDLSITLLYPGVLGSFIVDTMRQVNKSSILSHLFMNTAALKLLDLGKIILYLLTLAFFCCDYLGSIYIKPYKPINFLSDLAIMIIIIIIFGILGFTESRNNEVALNINYFCMGFMGFMLVYLIRFGFKKNATEKKHYEWLALLEIGSFICFGLIIGLNCWLGNTAQVWSKCTLIVIVLIILIFLLP